jgi:hypothetical protein
VSDDRLVRTYMRSHRARRRAFAVLNAVIDGLWLGAFDRDQLARIDEAHYDTLVERNQVATFRYSDEHWNTSGLREWEAAAVEHAFPAGARVVVTGAGGGREVLALLERGYDAIGYEPHPGLVAAGEDLLARHGHPGRMSSMGRNAFPRTEPFDALLAGWGSYMLTPGRAHRTAFLRGARERMPQGAPALLSFFVRSPDERDYARLAAAANLVRRVRRLEPAEVGDALRPNFVHHFTREELAAEIAGAGFALGAYAERPYGHALATSI